jgi:hypothetical protein
MMITAAIAVMVVVTARIRSGAMMGIETKMGRTAAVTRAIRIGDEGDLSRSRRPWARRFTLTST